MGEPLVWHDSVFDLALGEADARQAQEDSQPAELMTANRSVSEKAISSKELEEMALICIKEAGGIFRHRQ